MTLPIGCGQDGPGTQAIHPLPNPTPNPPAPAATVSALDRARRKAYLRLLPLLVLCYIIAYVDRSNVAIAKLAMGKFLPAFDGAVFSFGFGMFFIGYFLLEIPGSLMVEKWSARKWICRIMVTWGLVAALTAWVRTPREFYVLRFLLGLAEAGFFPGVVVYLTHWFSGRDRTRALASFMIATPVAQIVSPKISNALLKIGSDETINGVVVQHAKLFGLQGWQCMYIFWGLPAVVLGVVVLAGLTDRPRDAKWLTPEERDVLETELAADQLRRAPRRRMGLREALSHPKVLLLAAAYLCGTAANYGYEYALPSILKDWYHLELDAITWLVILPPILALAGQLFAAWNSDRTRERRLHTIVPLLLGVAGIAAASLTRGHLSLTIACFMVAFAGIKSYQPAFWALPSLFLTEVAAAGSIGLINSIGNLGGFVGPWMVGGVQKATGSYARGILCLAGSLLVTTTIVLALGLGRRESGPSK